MFDQRGKINLPFLFLGLLMLLFTPCKKGRDRIEIRENGRGTSPSSTAEYTNSALTPELFFTVQAELSRVVRRYQRGAPGSGTNTASGRMEEEIRSVYQKYHLSEEAINFYSENNYRTLENYLNQHPEIERQLNIP